MTPARIAELHALVSVLGTNSPEILADLLPEALAEIERLRTALEEIAVGDTHEGLLTDSQMVRIAVAALDKETSDV